MAHRARPNGLHMSASWYLIMIRRSRWYASEKGVVLCSLVGLCMEFYKPQSIFKIRGFKIRPASAEFLEKEPFLTFKDKKTTLEWPKLVSEAIFPTTWGIFGQGILGVKEDFQGVPWGHWVGLMGFLLIHKAYVPWSRFLARDGRVDGSTKDSIRGPRGPKKLGRWSLVIWYQTMNIKWKLEL